MLVQRMQVVSVHVHYISQHYFVDMATSLTNRKTRSRSTIWISFFDLSRMLPCQQSNVGRCYERALILPAFFALEFENNWNITIYMCALTAAMIRLHLK